MREVTIRSRRPHVPQLTEDGLRPRAPHALRRGLSAEGERQLDAWWDRLAADDRRSLSPARDRLEVVGRFTEEGPEGGEDAFPLDLYEYLVNHEISLSDQPGRLYHICTRHPAAARAVRAGFIPAAFSCPLGLPGCPMRRVLARGGGRALRLVARTV